MICDAVKKGHRTEHVENVRAMAKSPILQMTTAQAICTQTLTMAWGRATSGHSCGLAKTRSHVTWSKAVLPFGAKAALMQLATQLSNSSPQLPHPPASLRQASPTHFPETRRRSLSVQVTPRLSFGKENHQPGKPNSLPRVMEEGSRPGNCCWVCFAGTAC